VAAVAVAAAVGVNPLPEAIPEAELEAPRAAPTAADKGLPPKAT